MENFLIVQGFLESPYGRGKGFVYEGGIRVPMIATWNKKIKPGSITNHISAHYDVMPTLLELINYDNIPETDGISFLPTLTGKKEQDIHDFLYWEFPEYGGQVAIRMGDWKVIRRNLKRSDEKPTLELYNLSQDPEELNNVASHHSEIIHIASNIFERNTSNLKLRSSGLIRLKMDCFCQNNNFFIITSISVITKKQSG